MIPFFERQRTDKVGEIAVKLEIALMFTSLFNLITIIVYSVEIAFSLSALLQVIFYIVLALGFLSAYRRNLTGILVYIVIYTILIVLVGLVGIFFLFILSVYSGGICNAGYCIGRYVAPVVLVVLFCFLNLVDFYFALIFRNALTLLLTQGNGQNNAQFPMQIIIPPQYAYNPQQTAVPQTQTASSPYFPPNNTQFTQFGQLQPQPQNENIVNENTIQIQINENIQHDEVDHTKENEHIEVSEKNKQQAPTENAAVITIDESSTSYTHESLL